MTGHAHQEIIFALIILIPLTLWIGSRIGTTVPFLLGIITAAIMAFVVPHVPGSPIACLGQHPAAGDPCAQHMTWIWVLNIATPLGLAFLYAEYQDHRRRASRRGRRP